MAARRRARWWSRRHCRRCSPRAWTSSRGRASVLERGAIEGEIFHRGAVQALAPEETQVTPRLAALVRKELIRPVSAARRRGCFRFRHLLIRDAAYDALPKATRADLHAALRNLAGAARGRARRAGRDPRLRPRTGLPLPRRARHARRRHLAAAARRRLTAAGRRARSGRIRRRRQLFERAAALVPPAELDLALESDLVDVLLWAGTANALRRADSFAERASAAGDRVAESAGGSRRALSASTSSRRARPRRRPRSSSRRCPCSRPPA